MRSIYGGWYSRYTDKDSHIFASSFHAFDRLLRRNYEFYWKWTLFQRKTKLKWTAAVEKTYFPMRVSSWWPFDLFTFSSALCINHQHFGSSLLSSQKLLVTEIQKKVTFDTNRVSNRFTNLRISFVSKYIIIFSRTRVIHVGSHIYSAGSLFYYTCSTLFLFIDLFFLFLTMYFWGKFIVLVFRLLLNISV